MLTASATLAQTTIATVKGEVLVRRGVATDWQPAQPGDLLKPEDSMRLGKKSSSTIVIEKDKRISLPENIILDVADFRSMTKEELLLKLAMDRVLSIPDRKEDNEMNVPRTTVVHGTEKSLSSKRQLLQNVEEGLMQLNGTRFLYSHGFLSGSILRAKEVFRLYPDLQKRIEFRLMVASALERSSLPGEALSDYTSIAGEQLADTDRTFVEERIAELRKKD